MTGSIYQLKDPQAKGDTVYHIPSNEVEPTVGMKGKNFKGCLCRLHLENACRQGKKCKSYHVNINYIKKMREQYNVVLDTDFLTEVVVCTVVDKTLLVFAVKYPAVFRTRGLIEYRKAHARGQHIHPHRLCNDFRLGNCPLAGNCRHIHVKPSEIKGLNPKRLRTPCCANHGDVHNGSPMKVSLQLESGNQISLPMDCVAENEALLKASRMHSESTFTLRDLCMPHITGRCKYGKSCGNLHVCRSWWRKNQDEVAQEAGSSIIEPSLWGGLGKTVFTPIDSWGDDSVSTSSVPSLPSESKSPLGQNIWGVVTSPSPSPETSDLDKGELSLPVWDCTGFRNEASPLR